MSRIHLTALATVSVANTAAAQVNAVFTATSPTIEYAATMYRSIWDEDGARIIAALESRSCMDFPETLVEAIVAEATSNSGGPEHPMRLRASYSRMIKQSTLVHELGHRHLWQLEQRLDDIDGHMTLYLILDRVWTDVWGEDFASERVAGESGWHERYAEAWKWAASLTLEQRSLAWNELLTLNGFDSCDGLRNPSEQD